MVPYKSYIQIAQNHYRESFGLDFEDFQIGQRFKHRPGVTLSQQDNKDEALDTINNAQLHYDQHYAEQTEWKKCLGVSTLTLQNVLGMTWKTFAKKNRIIAYDDVSMLKPVFGGDTLYAESEIIDKKEYPDNPELGILSVLTSGINHKNMVVCEIKYQLLVYKKNKHPLDKTLTVHAIDLTNEKFSFYRELEDHSYMEEVGLYYEDLAVGEIYEHFPGKTFSEEESKIHSLRSLDWNPQYASTAYIQKYNNGKFLINEGFLVGAVTALTTRTFGRVVANLQWKNIRLPIAVFSGETINARSMILSKRESKSRPQQGIIEANTEAFNQDGKLVCAYERHFLIYKKGLGPYSAAGY